MATFVTLVVGDGLSTVPAVAQPPGVRWSAQTDDADWHELKKIESVATDDAIEISSSVDITATATAASGGPRLATYVYAEVCGIYSAGRGHLWPCTDGRVVDHSDVCGTDRAVPPLWRKLRETLTSAWPLVWTMISDVTCVGEQELTPEQIFAEFRRLQLDPTPLHVQPERSTVLVNTDTIAYTDPTPQQLTTTLLGRQITFTVTPLTYTWDFGELAEPFTTLSPGHPYPDQDVAYAFTGTGTGHVTLTTTWQATYRLDEDPTEHSVPGTATTTSSSASFQIVEVESHLVSDSCAEHPDSGGCS